jgi:phospholipid/cholesterol/gamma-HCH transport system substrate-binding protein
VESKVNFAAVGAFVIILAIAMIAGVLWLSSGKYYRKSYDTYVTYLTESVAGLNINAPVRYRGVDVGRVKRIALAAGNVEQVEVTLDIERGTPVKQDTIATLGSQGLTGIAFVELMAGSKESPSLEAKEGERYPVIASAPSFMYRLETAVPVLLANLGRASDNLNALLNEDNRRAVHATLADLAVLSRTLAARSATIDATLAGAARTMDNAARLTAELPALVKRVEQTTEAFDRMASEVAGAGVAARGTLDAAHSGIDDITGTTIPEIRALVVELRGLTAALRRVADEVERNPGLLVQGRRPVKRGPGE